MLPPGKGVEDEDAILTILLLQGPRRRRRMRSDEMGKGSDRKQEATSESLVSGFRLLISFSLPSSSLFLTMTVGEPCHPLACQIQTCLQKNNFNQAKCENLVDDLYRCCLKVYKEDPNLEMDSCPLKKYVDRRIDRMQKEGKSVENDGGER